MENTTKQGLVGAQIGKIKDWKELTADEKIERMKDIVKCQSSYISQFQRDIHYIRGSFAKHSHQNEKIIVPFSEYQSLMPEVASLSNENYF